MSTEKNEKPEAAAPAAAPAAAVGAGPKGGGAMGFLPLIIALVLAPVISWVVAEFVLLPRFKMQLMAMGAGAHGEAAPGESAEPVAHKSEAKSESKGEGKKEAKKAGSGTSMEADGPGSYRFDNVVVNLSGTMGTRYLKASFLVTGRENLSEVFEEREPQLLDATLNTLSSLTLSDLEEVGSRNLIRARLIAAYNETIGIKIVDQIYFSEFVVQ